MRRRRGSALLFAPLLAIALSACGQAPSPTPASSCPTAAPGAEAAAGVIGDVDRAVLRTNKGDFTMELYPVAAPIATENFVALARCGFYDGITFHRVDAGFVIQAGDPQTRDNHGDFAGIGTGGPGYLFPIEAPDPSLAYLPYVVAMANAGGSATNGSQFFIDLADLRGRLARAYTIFGKVVDGTATVDAIGGLPTDANDVPLDPAVILSVEVFSSASASPTP